MNSHLLLSKRKQNLARDASFHQHFFYLHFVKTVFGLNLFFATKRMHMNYMYMLSWEIYKMKGTRVSSSNSTTFGLEKRQIGGEPPADAFLSTLC